jgi:haloalkane dehalogenase
METTAPDWLDRNEYPFTLRSLNINGDSIHYIDEGAGQAVLFVHGTPSWSFDFRHLIKGLMGPYRCVALDHLGFGLSDKPCHGDYSIPAHTARLEALIGSLGLTRITLVVHDFGGPIALGLALRRPALFSRVVILNSWLFDMSHDPTYRRLVPILRSPLLPLLYRYLNFSPRFLLPSSFGRHRPAAHVLRHFTAPFPKVAHRQGPLAFARSLLHDQALFGSMWLQRGAIAHLPMLLIWGMADKAVTTACLYRFKEGFSQAVVQGLAGCGHFPQEEEPEAVLSAIRAFLAHHPQSDPWP